MGEVIHMETPNRENPREGRKIEASVSLNTQAVAGVIVVGLFMLGMRSNLRTVIANQKVIYDGLTKMNEGLWELSREAVTVKDVVQLAAKATAQQA